jgi:hypothetical protein
MIVCDVQFPKPRFKVLTAKFVDVGAAVDLDAVSGV